MKAIQRAIHDTDTCTGMVLMGVLCGYILSKRAVRSVGNVLGHLNYR